ncbi:Oidioi.mRNA.OKI2018_I69.chr2.g7994.t1.cds [Oikopleura dioica]|uniref:Oidioi.mRNA.OKI2018_I69.chr2.g7994.t1.cds n=1 Tax=Oikopleura dioica TaxID=34765 RepID=A0ABN7T8X8_OIKDI|nr:Oidioi.mRNA.OKI2018_I69.chr2.g7994.t1.cds [Oikopleura dioica]
MSSSSDTELETSSYTDSETSPDTESEISSNSIPESEMICHESLFPASFNRFCKFREESKGIDVVIKSGSLRFEAHKLVLASAIPYFEAHLMTSWKNGAEISLDIPGVDPEIIISVIKWAYTGEIELTNETAQSILVAAQYLGCEQVVTACFDFIERRMSTENVLDVLQLAERIFRPDLERRARQYIDRYFCDFYQLPVWTTAPAKLVMSILGSSDLYVKEEATVWSAFKIWLEANPSCEDKLVHEMLSQVRLHLLPPQFLQDEVLTFDLISSNAQCCALIDQAKEPKMKKRKRKISQVNMVGNGNDAERLKPRWCSHLENDIYILTTWPEKIENGCGFFQENYQFVRFDPDSKKCKTMPPMKHCWTEFGVAVLDGMIYAIGGNYSGKAAERFDPKKGKWESIASMISERYWPACCAMNGRIYVSGGGKTSPVNECYDPEKNIWQEIPSMKTYRSSAAAASFEDKMYVTGGYGDFSGIPHLDSVEVFDGKKWTEAPPMLSPRAGHGSLVFQGQLWVIGGETGPNPMRDCEQFNFNSQQWTRVQFREESKGVDVVIKSGSLRFEAHKLVLASAFPYFETQLMSSWKNGAEISLDIPGVDPEIIISVIEWAYTGEIELTNETAQSILVAAQYLGCEQVVTACFDFIERRMSTENVLDVLQLAERIFRPDLERRARQYIDRYFCDFYQLPVWTTAPAKLVMSILGSSDLYVKDETTVWSAFKIWLVANPSCEDKVVYQMLSRVRLHLLPSEFLRDEVLTFDLISSNAQCCALIDQAKKPKMKKRKRKISQVKMVENAIVGERLKPRWCSHLENDIYILTTWTEEIENGCEFFRETYQFVLFDPDSQVKFCVSMSFIDKKCKSMPPMEKYDSNFGLAVLNGMIYVLGEIAERFDPKKGKWESIASMICKRFSPACCAMNGRIYVSGGNSRREDPSPVNECYDPEKNVWEEIPSMKMYRESAAAASFEDKMYVTGGYDSCGLYSPRFDSVEVFDGKKWTEAPPMLSARAGHGSLIFQGKLWVVGGENGPHVRRSCEQFNFDSQQWTRVQKMNFGRLHPGVAMTGNRLFVLEGDRGIGDSFEIFDPENGWSSSNFKCRKPSSACVQVAAIPKNCSVLRF